MKKILDLQERNLEIRSKFSNHKRVSKTTLKQWFLYCISYLIGPKSEV